jgi:subtilisin-like proprotein convertase family protein
VTVKAHRVNVNSRDDYFFLTGNSNDVRQDFALVIATDPQSPGTMSVSPQALVANPNPQVLTFTNSIASSNAAPVFNQRVGANSALLFSANSNGVAAQWSFYVITNDLPNGSNVVFATFFPPNLSRARNRDADIDLFVSQNSDLTNLTPAVLDTALRSIKRGGSEMITLSNSAQGEVYYVGVKSEDAQGADFGFFAASSDQPFSTRDTNGNLIVNFINVPQLIPDGDPAQPQGAIVFGVAIDDGLPGTIRRVIVTNTITHQDIGDLQTVLIAPPNDQGQQVQVILTANNIFPAESTNTQTIVFDDSYENDPPPPPPLVASRSVGPGTLNDLIGQSAFGLWQFNAIDNAPVFNGSLDGVSFRVEPSDNTNTTGFVRTILGGGCFLDAVTIPAGATNFSVQVDILTPGLNAEVYIRRGAPPTPGIYNQDKFALFGPPGGTLSVTPFDNPPLNPGLYFVMICNPDPLTPLTVRIRYFIDLAATPGTPVVFTNSVGPITILDDARTDSVINVGTAGNISDISVGVRIDHPRVSDLVLHLRAPSGTRVLLAENRGGPAGQNFGAEVVGLTNIVGLETNRFDTSPPGLYSVGSVVDSWTVLTNPVTVVDDAAIADTPTRYLELSTGAVTRTLPTVAGQQYLVQFRYRQAPPLNFNGSFEVPPGAVGLVYGTGTTVGGWFVESGDVNHVIDFASGGWQPAQGTSSYDLNGNSGVPGIISQTIATTTGQRYDLQFARSGFPLGTILKQMEVFWAGGSLGVFDYDATGNSLANMNWAYTNLIVTGSGSDQLRLVSLIGGVHGPAVDDISLTPLASALVDVAGVVTTNITGTQAWQTFTASFTATGPTAMTIAGIDGGMLIDSFVLSEVQQVSSTLFTVFSEDTNATSRPMKYGVAPFIDNGLASPALTNYFLPEEPMTALRGQNAAGDWRLEIWDNRLGAPLGTLLNWQLSITYANAAPTITPLFNGQCVTGTVAGVGRQYFAVVVPGAATIGTNTLTTFGGPVNLDFNQNFLPIGGGPGDVNLLTGVAATGSSVLTTNGAPPLVPASIYYLAVANANPAETNAFQICVNFDVPVVPFGSFLAGSVAPGKTAHYTFNVPSGAATAVFDLTSLSAAADLVVMRGPDFPTDTSFHYKSAKPSTSDEQIVVTPSSSPVPLTAGSWNIGVVNKSDSNVTHQVRATSFDAAGQAQGAGWKPVALAPSPTPGAGAQVTWNTLIGSAYQAQYSSNLVNWVGFTNFTADKVVTTVIDPTPQSALEKRFYRLLKLP